MKVIIDSLNVIGRQSLRTGNGIIPKLPENLVPQNAAIGTKVNILMSFGNGGNKLAVFERDPVPWVVPDVLLSLNLAEKKEQEECTCRQNRDSGQSLRTYDQQ